MSRAKTLMWSALFLVTPSMAVQADTISAANGSWVFFGNSSTLQNQYPNLFAVASGQAPVTSTPPPAPAPAPTPVQNMPSITSNPAPEMQSGGPANAFINFGNAAYPEISQLTTGTPEPWYTSPVVTKFFGGSNPDLSQQAAFENQVLQDVQHTFNISGMNPTLTLSSTTPALHTLSVVSGISYASNPNAIGITDVGNNGFGFIDKFTYATSLTDLEWAVAHNISHELMHAFGIGYHPDQTGQYIDAPSATWALLTNPNTMFSPLATQVITATGYGANPGTTSSAPGQERIDGDQEILAAPVPEPTTIAIWSCALGGICLHARKRSRNAA